MSKERKIGNYVVVFLLVKFVVLFGQFGSDFKWVDADSSQDVPSQCGQVIMGRVSSHDHHVGLEVGHKTLDEVHDQWAPRGLTTAEVCVPPREKNASKVLAAPNCELALGLLGNHDLLPEQVAAWWLSLSCWWHLGGASELVQGPALDSGLALHWLSVFLIDLPHCFWWSLIFIIRRSDWPFI